MSESSWIRDDVDTVNADALRWSLSTLRSLTPEGTHEDVHLTLHRGRHRDGFTSTYLTLLEESRPDLYARVAPKRTLLPRPKPSSEVFDLADLHKDDPTFDFVLYMISLVEQPFARDGVSLPPVNLILRDYRGLWWIRSCAHLCIDHDHVDLLMAFARYLVPMHGDETAASILGMLHQHVIDSAHLVEPPNVIPLDARELDDEQLDLMMRRFVDANPPAPGDAARIQALARCVLGTRLYLEGHTALAERVLVGPAEASASSQEE